MKERPILFSTDMVKAILDGRKTQTRRIVRLPENPFPENWRFGRLFEGEAGFYNSSNDRDANIKCPYGVPGDLLYVRETWMPSSWSADGEDWCIHYKAGGKGIIVPHLFNDEAKELDFWIKISHGLTEAGCPQSDGMFEEVDTYMNWKPSIFMPKSAARIWLRITDVTVEPLHEISCHDIQDEGIGVLQKTECSDLKKMWIDLWDSINAKRGFSWESNPWVWVVGFDVISTNGRPQND